MHEQISSGWNHRSGEEERLHRGRGRGRRRYVWARGECGAVGMAEMRNASHNRGLRGQSILDGASGDGIKVAAVIDAWGETAD